MERKSTPEYETLKKFLPDICDSVSYSPNKITPLARNLSAANIVDFQVAGTVAGATTSSYDRVNVLITAAMGTIKSDPGKFETLLEKLGDQGLKNIVEKMEKHCGTCN